jgi:hypothetical protein
VQETGKFTRLRRTVVARPDSSGDKGGQAAAAAATSSSEVIAQATTPRTVSSRKNDNIKAWLNTRKKQLADREEREKEVRKAAKDRLVIPPCGTTS